MSCKVNYKQKRFQTYALSTETGIFISASAFQDDEQPMSAFVTRDADGNISAQIKNESLSSAHEEWEKNNSIQSVFIDKYCTIFQIVFSIILACIALIRVPVITVFTTVFWIASLFTSALYNVSHFTAALLYNKFKMPSIARYHAAEHMAFHAANEYKRVPTLLEISKESMYAFRCTTTDVMIIPTIVSVLRNIVISAVSVFGLYGLVTMAKEWHGHWQYSLIFVISAACIAIIGKFLNKLPNIVSNCLMKHESILKLFQWIVVSKPSKNELEVAQQAIQLRFLMDETINNDKEGYAFEDVSFDILHKKAIYTFNNGKTGTTSLVEYISSVLAILNAEVKEVNDEDENTSNEESASENKQPEIEQDEQ